MLEKTKVKKAQLDIWWRKPLTFGFTTHFSSNTFLAFSKKS